MCTKLKKEPFFVLDNSVINECVADVPCPYQNIALPLYANRTIKHQPVDITGLAAQYAAFARNFILESRNSPFFLYAALSHIHVPLAHAALFNNVTGRGVFTDTLYEMDWLVGEILEAAHAAGNNTLVWFMSDNGPWEVKCQLAGSQGPYTGFWQRTAGGGGSASKTTVWEAGHRVPSIVHWQGRIKAGSVSAALVSALDVLPTLVSLTNSTLPLHRHLDGMDVSGILTGSSQRAHQVLFHPNCDAGPDGEIGAVRIGEYKTVFYTGGVPDCSGTIGPLVHHTPPLIFNLAVDPSESSPLEPKQEQYQDVLRVTSQTLADLLQDIRGDNTSTVDYSTSSDARPCCDENSAICRCTWD
uniref:Sulfatase N-terminal domain-containing protein n=1 Tax=Timema cristinae TaxID=61476 RepID=A0A7R9H6Y5_TIMCR|nr:unnamed protein product [Timema cristinae]